MELDQLRHSAFLNATVSFEDLLVDLRLLQKVNRSGFGTVFEQNLERDIDEIEAPIAKIEQARLESEAAAEQARIAQEA